LIQARLTSWPSTNTYRRTMSSNALYYCFQVEDKLSANERALMAALSYFAIRKRNYAEVSLPKLMHKSGLSAHYLAQTVDLLVTKKLLRVERTRNPIVKYKNSANTYHLAWVPEVVESVEDEGNDIFGKVFDGAVA